MIIFTQEDRLMVHHVVGQMRNLATVYDGYSNENSLTLDKLEALSKCVTSAVVVTSDDVDADARQVFRVIVRAELANWVPNASQRLLWRAGRALGIPQPNPAKAARDCGGRREDHPLMADWIAGTYAHRCTACLRLFAV